MPVIYVENRRFELADLSGNLLEACLSLGFDVPYFCWHPALGSVGACRQCAVKVYKDEADTHGRIVMSCMTPLTDGLRVSVADEEAREFRARVIEWLMLNHPHDCPICDEGGECHLQDMTVMTQHVRRHTRFPKRTHRNQDLGPFLNHEMNRCIQCYRCVRFYSDHAGGGDLGVRGAHDNVYFGRPAEGTLESEFAGNLVEVCPTGVFTDKTLKRHYSRKWDLQTAPSLCPHCSLGCNTAPGARYGSVRRIRTRYHHEINGYFLCDRGRYGYEFLDSPLRLREPLLQSGNSRSPVSADSARDQLAKFLAEGPVVGIGSPRASLESNFALRSLVSPSLFFSPLVGDPERSRGAVSRHHLLSLTLDILRQTPASIASLRDASLSDAVLILGENVPDTAPRLALALRQAAFRAPRLAAAALHKLPAWHDAALRLASQDRTGPFCVATPDATRLDPLASAVFRASPDGIAQWGLAVAHALDPEPPDGNLPAEILAAARKVAAALQAAAAPLVVSGSSCGSPALLQAAANVARALKKVNPNARLCLTAPECNSVGLALLNPAPLDNALAILRDGRAKTLVVLEADLYRHAPAPLVDELLGAAKNLVVLDCLQTPTAAKAHLALPAAAFDRADGTLVNNEGRAQRFYSILPPAGAARESWRWLGPNGTSWDDLLKAMAQAVPALKAVVEVGPPADFRLLGRKIARYSARSTGRTAVDAAVDVREPKPADDPDTPLAYSMEGTPLPPPADLLARYWAPGWNSDQSLHKFQAEIAGPLRGGPTGRRLIEPAGPSGDYFPPPSPAARQEDMQFLPAWHVFGSDELSVLSPGVAHRSPGAYVAVNPRDAARLGLAAGCPAVVRLAGLEWVLPVEVHDALPPGVAAMPAGVPGVPWVLLPAAGTIAGKEERP